MFRDIEQLKADFKNSGAEDFYTWLAQQPEGDPTAGNRKQENKKPLLGDRIAAATKAVGIQPCSGCKKRQKWFNEKHQKLRQWGEKVKKID